MKRINLPALSFVFAFVLALGVASDVRSQPTAGTCDIGSATGTFDGNRVTATVFTAGSMFFGPGSNGAEYLVEESSPVFASSVWLGGRVNGQLRVAGTTYGQGNVSNDDYEFWPGPLNADGSLPNPNDCSQYDRIWKVSRQDIADYEAGGAPATDLEEWPWDLGAPVIDGDGNPDNYNLEGGDRPDIIGDQSLWWVMNDVGNVKNSTLTPPLGLEVRVQMFGFDRDNPLGETTFYKFTLLYKGEDTLTEARITVFSDPDLGSAVDDYVGSDTTLSMGYVYNADNNDDGNYGLTPPATGYDFFQGPLVDAPGERWEDPCYDPELSDAENEANGCLHVDQRRLGMTVFNYFNNDGSAQGNPGNGAQYWNYMNGLWKDGDLVVACGNGLGCSGEETVFVYPGDPTTGEFWSEENNDEAGTKNPAGDRRFLVTTGPFEMEPGDVQEIVFGIVYARGVNRLSSVNALRAGDVFAQNAFDLDFDLPVPAPAPQLCDPNNPNRLPGSGQCFTAAELDGELNLTWGYAPTDDGYLGDYVSKGYQFEGFNVYEYPNSNFASSERELVATYDKVNDITTVHNFIFDPQVGEIVPVLAATGTDSGLNYSVSVTSTNFGEGGALSNYTDYFFGLTTYMVDETQEQERVVESAPRTIAVRPSNVRNADGGTTLGSEYGELIEVNTDNVVGGGTASAMVIDPTALTGDTYRVRWFEHAYADTTVLTYNIERGGDVLFNGGTYAEQNNGEVLIAENVFAADGLSFSVNAPPNEILAIVEAVGPGGIDPCGVAEPAGGCPAGGGPLSADFPGDIVRQSFNSTSQYIGYHSGDGSEFSAPAYAPNDFEIRWGTLDEGFSYGYYGFSTGNVIKVPFTVWDIGVVAPGSENDPSDDIQLIPLLFADGPEECVFQFQDGVSIFGFGGITQRIYGRYPVNDDYSAYHAAAEVQVSADPDGCAVDDGTAAALIDGDRSRPIQREIIEDATGGSLTFEDIAGSVIRFYTFDPIQAGDTFVFNTTPYVASTDEGLTQEDVDRIAITPNPYKGFSAYESANAERIARFTNLPERATIRIFTISGTLVRTLEKDNPSRSFDWNLQTEGGLPVASGLYLIHIELPESGLERVLKFGVVNRQTQIPIL